MLQQQNFMAGSCTPTPLDFSPRGCCKLQRREFTPGKTWDMGRSYQHEALLEKHARIRSLRRILHIKSNSSGGLRWCFISSVFLEPHKHVTMRTSVMAFARGAKSPPVVESFAFLILPVTAESALIETPSYLIVCFAPTSAFPGKQATTHV